MARFPLAGPCPLPLVGAKRSMKSRALMASAPAGRFRGAGACLTPPLLLCLAEGVLNEEKTKVVMSRPMTRHLEALISDSLDGARRRSSASSRWACYGAVRSEPRDTGGRGAIVYAIFF